MSALSFEEKLALARAEHAQQVAAMTPPVPERPVTPPSARRTDDQSCPADVPPAWATFLAADEVSATVAAYEQLRRACGVREGAHGWASFEQVLQASQTAAGLPHRTRSHVANLADCWKARRMPAEPAHLIISGAGPVGLRAAVEAALMGMHVHVVEKREVFSRVNIFTQIK